jgi:hypothetical protein
LLYSSAQASFFTDKNSHAYTIELIGISETSCPTEPLFKMIHFNGLAGTDVTGNTSMNHYANADHTVFKDAAVTTIEGFSIGGIGNDYITNLYEEDFGNSAEFSYNSTDYMTVEIYLGNPFLNHECNLIAFVIPK